MLKNYGFRFIALWRECKIHNAKCKIVVFASQMIQICALCAHHNFEFVILNFE